MTKEQANEVIELLKSMNKKLDYIQTNTTNIEKSDSNLDDVIKGMKLIKDALERLQP